MLCRGVYSTRRSTGAAPRGGRGVPAWNMGAKTSRRPPSASRMTPKWRDRMSCSVTLSVLWIAAPIALAVNGLSVMTSRKPGNRAARSREIRGSREEPPTR
jgi:hypothetical protein